MKHTDMQRGPVAIEARLRTGALGLIPYLTAGYPRLEGFARLVANAARRSAVVEIGLPFSDPLADGPVIQRTSRLALEAGAGLEWLCAEIAGRRDAIEAPLVLMSYLNPLLARGLERSCADLFAAGFDGLIVPDLPLEEGAELRHAAEANGLASIQLVTPLTPPERVARLAAHSTGFLYAVTRTGITGAGSDPGASAGYLAGVRAISSLPVCAGFGIRTRADVEALAGHVDGVIVGSALLEALDQDIPPAQFLAGLEPTPGVRS